MKEQTNGLGEICIQVNTEGIDEAIEKANRLKELLEEVQTSIDSLSSKNHKENMAVIVRFNIFKLC